ncbi:hypothetical protein GN244_ATG19811 [Phytophthora infestans]|uniref:Uncharacterized protein n=1 Tax=Phytophthora infestans TaxID=4787 RepID=A0A833W4Q8_PHYIN|nr:hypothetical protein GN244_ATG19811 [Phytophthora infestans]
MSVTGGALAWDGTVWLSWVRMLVPARAPDYRDDWCCRAAEACLPAWNWLRKFAIPNEAVAGANVLVGTAVRVTLRDDCGGGNGEASY